IFTKQNVHYFTKNHFKQKFSSSLYNNVDSMISNETFPASTFECWNLAAFIITFRSKDKKDVGVPFYLLRHFKCLLSENYGKRQSPIPDFLNSQFFDNNLINVNLFLLEINLKTKLEKIEFFAKMKKQINNLPRRYLAKKVLPVLLEIVFQDFEKNEDILYLIMTAGNFVDKTEYNKL
ncbi:hypothetical protein MHBO_004733, partial [Bonamia ostreae]